MLPENHPLRDSSHIEDWKEWKRLWNENETADVRLGLLHIGFGVYIDSFQESIERIVFYLEIADGCHGFTHHFECPGDPIYGVDTAFGKFQSFASMRQNLAKKAFSILALRFFKGFFDEEKQDSEIWTWLSNIEFLEKLIWFFRSEGKERLINLRGGASDVHVETVNKFLFQLYIFAFTFKRFAWCGDKAEEVRNIVVKIWPDLIEILYNTGKTDMLLDKNLRHVLRDKACNEKLKELVMNEEYWLPSPVKETYRKAKTLNEAVFTGALAARTLHVFEIMRSEEDRFDKIREAERTKEDAERVIKRYA